MDHCTLASTGTDPLPFVVVAGALLIVGVGVLVLARRRRHALLGPLALAALLIAALTVSPAVPVFAADCDPAPTTVNTAPVARAVAATIGEDATPASVGGDLLSDASDADGDTLTVTNAGTVTLNYGTLVVQANGSYSYTLDNTNPAVGALNSGQSLTDTFSYTISDGRGGTASATLTITITGTTDNVAPIARNDIASIKEDTVPNPITGNLLTNDSDADADPLAVTTIGTMNLGYGVLVVQANGSYSYTLDNTNPAVNALNNGQSLTDAFTYTISDGQGGTASATLTITINGTTDNTRPSANDDSASIKEDSVPNPITGNLIANDSDAEGDALSVVTAGSFTLSYGTLTIQANGSFSYLLDNTNPAVDAMNDGQSINDTFIYTISDGHGGTASATLTIRINGTTD